MELRERVDFSIVRGKSLLVALSGGADSVALLRLLAEERPNVQLTAAHVEHGLRGEASLEDAEFCRALCDSLGVPLYVIHVDVRACAREKGVGVETAAREVRYRALRETRSEVGADLICLAHHMDDQAETVLMHLLRGCGLEGARGMRPLQGTLCRPLLGVRRSELEAYLKELGQPWRMDATNALNDNPRNRLRNIALPELRSIYPGADAALARFAEAAACDDDLLERLTDEFCRERVRPFPAGCVICLKSNPPEALLRRTLRRLLPPGLTHEQTVALSRLASGRRTIPGWGLAERTSDALYLVDGAWRPPEPAALTLQGSTSLDGIGRIEAELSAASPIRDDLYRQVLRADALRGAVLRTRRHGDRMRPLGARDRLLSDILTDKKILRPLRDTIPLVAKGERILWAVGVAISEEAKLTGNDDDAVKLTWTDAPAGRDQSKLPTI